MNRVNKTTYGAVRWDAWYPARDLTDTSAQSLKALSRPEYHFRAPFFAEINEEGNIIIPEYTQEIFDREMEYAIEAGINYFSYVWYSHSGLRMARDFHTKSKYRNQVKLCAFLDNNAILKDYAHEELIELFKEDFYQKINDRPLVYYFAWHHTVENIKKDIAFYKEACEKENIPAPFFVVCGIGPKTIKEIGGDAISRYSIGGSKKTFREFLDTDVYTIWERHGREGREEGIDNVLPLTAGWHPHPRFDTPVTWMKVEENDYVGYATCEEIKEQYKLAKEYLSNEANFDITKSNTCIIYAWNEHDEGGWLCPTLKVDESGNQLYSENGEKLIDTSRLDAVKEIIK